MGTHPIFESDFDCLTELEMSNNRKLLVASVLKFLKKEIESKKITPDQEESLNVATQCLSMAFNTSAEDAKDLPDLLDLLSKACPDKMGKTEVTEEQKELAQKFKNEGNALVKEQKYKEAIEKYTEAINCQESAIFYCNRAAAYTSLTNYEEALQDCKKAISLDPDNESYKKNLEIVKEKLKEQQAAAPAGFPGMPGGMPGMPGGMPGMDQMGSMMEQVMQNPQMRQMAESIMQNPQYQNMMQNMMGSMGMPTPEGADAAMPNLPEAMAGINPQAMQAGMAMAQQMMQENPEAVEQMRQMMGGMMGGPDPSSK